MAFVKLIPRFRYKPTDIRVSFCLLNKILHAHVYISLNLMEEIGWNGQDRVCIYYDSNKHRKWMIEKASTKKDGFKLVETRGKGRKYFKVVFRFVGRIKECERRIRNVNFEINDGKIIVNNSYNPKVSNSTPL